MNRRKMLMSAGAVAVTGAVAGVVGAQESKLKERESMLSAVRNRVVRKNS